VNSLTVDVGGVKLDLLRHDYCLLDPKELVDGITLLSLPDLAAMKLNAVANRGSKKCFYALCVILDVFTIRQMMGQPGLTGRQTSAPSRHRLR